MSIEVGQQAPDFTLFNTKLEKISLKELRTKSNVVMLFFPLAFTNVCKTELCSTRDEISIYENLNATVLGISVDSPFCLAKFREENELPFDLLSDFNKDVAKQYDSLCDDERLGFKGLTKRSAFVIDKQGQIKYAEILENADKLPDFDQIKQTLENCN
ncbi:unnamed protein product [Adineta ricciae]|uniref:Thioredoxin domain-containing protein n=1 Tax=Adineta ricciae TaxID=249248 RepID=A0A814ZBG8_ADIRI|nr:unnamed protein product [Adineta ricciae]CAF1239682.1 unnamed protein product [Adineta ricciae]